MVTDPHLQGDVFGDGTFFIGRTIGVEDMYGTGQFLGVETALAHKFNVYTGSFTATVNECLGGMD